MIYVIIIKHGKFSYNSIESQLRPCAPAFYLHTVRSYSTFSNGGAFGIQSNIFGEAFLRK